MRWILVFLFLYLIPLVTIFRNYKNFKRSCIYSSIYIVLVTSIVITNIYMSGLNKIEEAMYYQNYANEDRYKEPKKEKTIQNKKLSIEVENTMKDDIDEVEKDLKVDKDTETDTEKEVIVQKDDMEIIYEFKREIYEIEKIALIPMRDCMPYTKNIAKNISRLAEIEEDIKYAKEKCTEVILQYENMEIPKLSTDEYTETLDKSRDDLIKTYELREKAMENSLKLIQTKNPTYIGKITEYLELSDNHIRSFKDRISDLKEKVEV